MIPLEIQPSTAFGQTDCGAWSGVPMSFYQCAPGESNSLLALLARSPRRYQMTRDGLLDREPSTHDQMLGTMIHASVGEGVEIPYYLRPDTYQGKVDAKKDSPMVDKPWNANSNTCKEWLANHCDKPILTAHEALMLNSVVACATSDVRAAKLMNASPTIAHEVTAIARNESLDAPYLLRARFDILGCDAAGWYFIEIKSTRDASTDAFSREILKRLYHVQCALYRRVLRRLSGQDDVRAYMWALEKDAAIPRSNFRQLAKAAMDAGDHILDERLALLKKCKMAKSWPEFADYEEGEHVPFIDLPEWCYSDADLLTGMTEKTESTEAET